MNLLGWQRYKCRGYGQEKQRRYRKQVKAMAKARGGDDGGRHAVRHLVILRVKCQANEGSGAVSDF